MKAMALTLSAALAAFLLHAALGMDEHVIAPIRVAVNEDNGNEIDAYVVPVHDVLNGEPEIRADRITALQIRNGILANYDVLVMPGGGPHQTRSALGTTGYRKIREFVAAGGGYVGQCNGMYQATFIGVLAGHVVNYPALSNGSGTYRIRKEGTGGQEAFMFYMNGPILDRKTVSGVEPYVILATFAEGGHHHPLKGRPAIVAGQYGDGNVIGSAGHFEHMPGQEHLLVNQVRWAARGTVASTSMTWHDVFERASKPARAWSVVSLPPS